MRYSNESVHSQLWSRLLQMLVMAGFFVMLLWVIRARMIRPVLEMTAIAEGVARGEVCAPLPGGGPVELEGLAMQIRRISEYIEENKRIEDELRNKMFMFKKAKEQAELEKRSKSEFMAYVCQEMRTPINTIIGAAQVMKDQLYGPIENRKYRQYAADIYTTGNLLLDAAQDVLTQSKAETDYLALDEKPVDVQDTINRTLRFLADKMQVEKLNVKVKLQEPLPRLVADEFRLQQIIMNVLLYVLEANAGRGHGRAGNKGDKRKQGQGIFCHHRQHGVEGCRRAGVDRLGRPRYGRALPSLHASTICSRSIAI